MTTQPYQLILLGDDATCARLADAMRDAVRERIGEDLVEMRSTLGVVDDDPARDAPHRVAVWIGPEGDGLDSLQHAIDAALPVLPVAIDGDYAALPGRVSTLNAMSVGELAPVVEVLLRMLGLAERERRVFISYRRDDTTPLAEQLRHALLDRGFDVFIDRFAIEPGDKVQQRIDIELGDKAFVLVLESATMHRSPWIRHEITYAVEHGLALHSLLLPDVEDAHRIADLNGQRDHLSVDDLEDGRLTPQALEAVCRRVEVVHAGRLRRHREQMLDALVTWLEAAGYEAQAGRDWTVVAVREAERRVYLITPRAPTARDLYQAHLTRERIGSDLQGVVAHNPRDLDAEVVALNQWVALDRKLETAVLEDLRAELQAS